MRRMPEDYELERKPLTWNYAISVLKTFVHYYGPHRRLFYLSLFCALAQAACTTVIPLLVYDAFNTYLPARNYPMIWMTVGLLALLSILVALGMFVCTKYGHVLGVRMEADMRNDLFAHLQRLSFKYYDKAKTGHLMSRVTNDLTMIAELAHHGPEDMTSAVLMLIGALVVMFCINPLLTLITLIPLPFIFLWAYFFQGRMRRGFREARREVAEINSQVENSIQGIREVKSFTNERREIMRFRRVNSSYRHVREGIFDAMAKFHAGVMFFIQGYSIFFIIAGMILMYFEKANVIQIMTFFMYSKSVTMPVMRIVEFAEQFHQGVTAYERFYEILQVSPDITEKPDAAVPSAPFRGDLELDHVTFSYDGKEIVLDDINMSIGRGKTIALVGESGAGKTTLAALIPRFYDVCRGAIRIDGTDIRDYSLHFLRRSIGIVQQTPFLFDTTIRDNILFGRLDATEKELIEAVKEARSHGDLSENFEYHAAKKEKNRNESRIRYLERMIRTARVISDASKEDEVGIYNTVDVYFEEDDETETYKIVTTVRGNSLKGLISSESPLGKALLGHKLGDRVHVQVNETSGYDVIIKRIEKTVDDGSDALRSF